MDCKAMTKNGQPCRAAAQTGKDYCFLHDPANVEGVAAARRKGGRARRDQLAGKVIPCLTSSDDVRCYLNRIMGDTERMLISPSAARAIAHLCKIQLEAVRECELREIIGRRG